MTMKAETDLLESITTMRNVVAKLVSPEAASIAQSGPELQQLLVGKRLLINHFQTPAEYQMHCGEARKSEDHGYEQQNVNCHLSASKLLSLRLTDIRLTTASLCGMSGGSLLHHLKLFTGF